LNRQLLELSRLYGIQTSYLDMTKQRRMADPESLLLVLKAMGVHVDRMADVPEALRRRKEELRKRRVEPVMVAWDGKLGSRRFELGYHDVEIEGRPVFVIAAPTKAYFPNQRMWGVFAPVYALHSKRNLHAGDLTDFGDLMDWMHGLGGRVGATLPLLGAFLHEPFEPSPYSPATRLFWNEFYIDVQRIPEYSGSRRGKTSRKTKFVDYRGVMADKRHTLEKLARGFFTRPPAERLRAFRKFVRENKGVEDYARFRAVMDRERASWHRWHPRLRDGVIRSSDYDESTKNYHLYAQWIVQEQLEDLSRRAEDRGQFLYLDLPLGLHTDGYDIWRNREFFVQGVAGGAPPDPVFTHGQNWGFPPMNPEAMRLNRYQYIISYVRNHFRFAKLLRIDHVMGMHRLYWIPDQLTGDKGVYVEYPAEELWAILCLESHRYRAGIIGENLGTVPPEVNAAMTKHDIRQMYVVQYEIMGDPKNPGLRPPPRKCVASLNTHDMPPFQAFLDGTDIDDRVELGFIDEKIARKERRERRLMRAAIETWRVSERGLKPSTTYSQHAHTPCLSVLDQLADSQAEIVLLNLEDLWGETRPQNIPATGAERPNWRRRVRPSLEQIRKMSALAEELSNVFAQRSRSLSV
jgi:4-alpha-glucanotransferase